MLKRELVPGGAAARRAVFQLIEPQEPDGLLRAGLTLLNYLPDATMAVGTGVVFAAKVVDLEPMGLMA
ncbi:hypothetical protein GQ55_6G279900 [Panicum hallii var. hallii]|uniref:Uncharacterized protein n=1 Tax=Panicum hallii var. hallii TaxID=1504633 RepID=A0A2T7DAE0_9POAL|nr:hypothetical protein GQ55_6G279900 [Panicum hallii var. hallii]